MAEGYINVVQSPSYGTVTNINSNITLRNANFKKIGYIINYSCLIDVSVDIAGYTTLFTLPSGYFITGDNVEIMLLSGGGKYPVHTYIDSSGNYKPRETLPTGTYVLGYTYILNV